MRFLAALTAAAVLLCARADAQSPAVTSLSLQGALDYAHTHSPLLLAQQQHVAAVRAGEITAGLRLNPQLQIYTTQTGLASDDPNGPSFEGAGLSRVFELGGKRSIRQQVAQANTAVADASAADQRRTLDLQVRAAFTRVLQARSSLAIANDNLAGYRQTVSLMQIRLDAGDVTRTDFERIELQLAGFEADQSNAALSLAQARIQLAALIGLSKTPGGVDAEGSLATPGLPMTLQQLEEAAVASRPDLLANRRQVQANESSIRLADANRLADPQLGAEYEHSGVTSTYGLNLQIPLRVFDRNQGERARTRYETESSRLAVLNQQNQVIADVDAAYATYLAAGALSDRYQSKYLAEAAHVRDNLQFAYRNGGATLLDYLSALQDYRQVNLAALNAQAQAQLALHQLSYAAATEINP